MVRFTNAFATGVFAVAVALGVGVLFGGCASNDSGSAPAKQEQPAKAAEPAKPAPAKGAAAPAGSKLAQVKNDMTPEQVQQIMGSPSGQANYPTAKAWAPYGMGGNDSGTRVEYKYKGQGRVVFMVPRYGGNMKVVRVDYDPNEDGN